MLSDIPHTPHYHFNLITGITLGMCLIAFMVGLVVGAMCEVRWAKRDKNK